MQLFSRGSRIAGAFLLAAVLSACGNSSDEERYRAQQVEPLYNRGVEYLLKGEYVMAARAFNEVERQHPYSTWATKSQLMSAYSFYQYNEYENAVLSARRFLSLHPGHRDAPYAYYLIAVSYYEQISDVLRDQEMTELALNALNELVRRYPSSDYARDARLKIDLARDHLAGKEMAIGRYYMGQHQYIAAINRFDNVVDEYETTTHVPEALHRLTEAFIALGLDEEAQAQAAVLGHNFPGSVWYRDSYNLVTNVERKTKRIAVGEDTGEEDTGSWISRAWDAIF